MQVYTGLLETVGGVLALALTPHCTLLPQPYVAMLLHSPMIGQDDARTQMRLSAVSDLWSGESHRVRRRPLTAGILCLPTSRVDTGLLILCRRCSPMQLHG